MNAFKRLTIENFQSHKKTVVEPAGKGQLTVIVGPSDSGKTAIIRSLRWLLFNDPQGDQFIRVGATLCRVTLELESGHTVIRERSRGSINRYKLISPGKEAPGVFEGFGINVPLEVAEVTGVRGVRIGDLDLNLNLSEQLDGPFLGKSISSGARAKVLGKLAGTEEIDYAGAQLNKDLYHSNQAVRRLDDEIKGLDDQIEWYGWLGEMKERIERVEGLVSGARQLIGRRGKLAELNGRLIRAEEAISSAQITINRWQGLKQAEQLVREAGAAGVLSGQLKNLNARLAAADKVIEGNEKVVNCWQGVHKAEQLVKDAEQLRIRKNKLVAFGLELDSINDAIVKAEDKLSKRQGLFQAAQLVKEAEEIRVKRERLSGLISRLKNIGVNMNIHQNIITGLKEQLPRLEQDYLDKLAELGICPVCGNTEFSPERIKEVV